MRRMRKLCLGMLAIFCLCACNSEENMLGETDWREQYEKSSGNSKTEKEGYDDGNIGVDKKMPIPTMIPVSDFTPGQEQTKLVIMLDYGSEAYFDNHIVAELNLLLQRRGYPFYVSVMRDEREDFELHELRDWQEVLNSDAQVDVIYIENEDSIKSYMGYGNTGVMCAIQDGYILPFSEYPEGEAKRKLLQAFPEAYWTLTEVNGENYGVSNVTADRVNKNKYILFNMDVAEQVGIEAPERLDLTCLDEMLEKVKDAKIPGVFGVDVLHCCGIGCLPSGLYLKYSNEGEYCIINPLEDEMVIELADAMHRYEENGWVEDNPVEKGMFPLVAFVTGGPLSWNQERFFLREQGGEISARVKVYEKKPQFMMEGDLGDLMGISANSEYKEEALELLSLMYSDAEVIELLRYGVEGVHYRNGEYGPEPVEATYTETDAWGDVTTYTEIRQSPGNNSLGNRLMYLDIEKDWGMMNTEEEQYEAFVYIEKIPYMEQFTERQKAVLKKVWDITCQREEADGRPVKWNNISSYLFLYDEADYKEKMKQLLAMFYDAGYQSLAEEINNMHEMK